MTKGSVTLRERDGMGGAVRNDIMWARVLLEKCFVNNQ